MRILIAGETGFIGCNFVRHMLDSHMLEGSFTEDFPLNPRKPYSETKASVDFICKSFFAGISLVIMRSSNNYGPYQYLKNFLHVMILNTLRGKKMLIYSNGRDIGDRIYVKDNCIGIDIAFHRGKDGEVYKHR